MTEHLLTIKPDETYRARVNAQREKQGLPPYSEADMEEDFILSITCLHPDLCAGWIECSEEHPNSDPEDDESPVYDQYDDVMMHGVPHDHHDGMWTVPYKGCVVRGGDWETPDDLYPLRAGEWIVEDEWEDTCVYLNVVREVATA